MFSWTPKIRLITCALILSWLDTKATLGLVRFSFLRWTSSLSSNSYTDHVIIILLSDIASLDPCMAL